ncbi:hypothetical protein VNI00_019203 [Paramarasmius palmivorus]|uniref:C2H2-type domain-containing protein n=1 Tax=Paramarasmius palmivorus TaxID=297713 RepID=A0AAW0APD6_9AGAR
MVYTCVGCQKEFSRQNTLSRHEPNCSQFQDHEARLLQARRQAPSLSQPSSGIRRPATTLGRLGLPNISSVPGLPRRTHTVNPESETYFGATGQNVAHQWTGDVTSTSADTTALQTMAMSLPSPPPPPSYSESPSPAASPPPPAVTQSGRPARSYRLPARYRDNLPEVPPPVIPTEQEVLPTVARRVTLFVRDRLHSMANSFGIWREYEHRPTFDPDHFVPLEQLANYHKHHPNNTAADSEVPPSESTMLEQADGNSESDVILDESFNAKDFVGFSVERENKRLDDANQDPSRVMQGFVSSPVKISVLSGEKDIPSVPYSVPNLQHRDLLDCIRTVFASPLASKFHFSLFKLFHVNEGHEEPERIFSELYTTDAFIREHDYIQRCSLPADQTGCKLERVIAALMFWSDSTHLATFGNAKLWPIYLLFGNLSNSHLIAPQLPDSFDDFVKNFHPKWKTQQKDIRTHCRRELMHEVWKVLLTDAFIHACKYGFVVKCFDGKERRVFPRIFTYSADYPEKVLLATIRDGGLCPCPRCLTPKSLFHRMGMKLDIRFRLKNIRRYLLNSVLEARRIIYELGQKIGGARVDRLLKGISAVPTINAFIDRIGESFDPSQMLVVDLMHEFELGVWKALFTHLIRILYASPNGVERVNELNLRYRTVPVFGTSTIRRFASNASEMKKLAARDFEDLLQCAIPVSEGLLEEPHNKRLLKLLYCAAEWHALAKLRMHTESTLQDLRSLTEEFGKLMREFDRLSCSQFNTVELEKESTARARREQEAARRRGDRTQAPTQPGRKPRKLNLNTYKYHAMADYAATIERFGTTDSYSTQIEAGFSLIGIVGRALPPLGKMLLWALEIVAVEYLEPLLPEQHHQMSNRRDYPQQITPFLQSGSRDPAKKDFLRKLKEHLLERILDNELDRSSTSIPFTDDQRNQVNLVNARFYAVKTLRINYTTYDVRWDYDYLNPATDKCMVMVRSPETQDKPNAHPYWYARVLGIFHAQVAYRKHGYQRSTQPQFMEFLWVHWMGVTDSTRSGRQSAHLPRVSFIPEDDKFAFGFLDPALIIRAAHLIPQFAQGRTNDLLHTEEATAARAVEETSDWKTYYVNIFVDRDMFMRYRGGGIGHVDLAVQRSTDEGQDMEDDEDLEDEPLLQEVQDAINHDSVLAQGTASVISPSQVSDLNVDDSGDESSDSSDSSGTESSGQEDEDGQDARRDDDDDRDNGHGSDDGYGDW